MRLRDKLHLARAEEAPDPGAAAVRPARRVDEALERPRELVRALAERADEQRDVAGDRVRRVVAGAALARRVDEDRNEHDLAGQRVERGADLLRVEGRAGLGG